MYIHQCLFLDSIRLIKLFVSSCFLCIIFIYARISSISRYLPTLLKVSHVYQSRRIRSPSVGIPSRALYPEEVYHSDRLLSL